MILTYSVCFMSTRMTIYFVFSIQTITIKQYFLILLFSCSDDFCRNAKLNFPNILFQTNNLVSWQRNEITKSNAILLVLIVHLFEVLCIEIQLFIVKQIP